MKQRITFLFAGGLLALTLFGVAAAGQLEDSQVEYLRGQTALLSGDYATAMRLWLPLAEHGNAQAQVNLGGMYELGNGVPPDGAQAVKWFRKAADQGDVFGQFLLGEIYFRGEVVPQNYAEAAAWYSKAADRGDYGAQFKLGSMYENGQGVPQDYVRAHMWYNLSTVRTGLDANFRDEAIERRNAIAAKMTPAQIAEAQRMASEWTSK